ncbi:hypothetical protein [Cyanobium sp. ATX-6F1]|uniref:hypothetical protein n=1 Tax=Cyanobium sp. ATX-6F1 TaxID=3137388 RepID=UPI0039BE1783
MSHSRRFGWGRRLRQLLAALLAAALAVAVVAALPTALGGAAPGNPAAAVGPPAGFVELEGRRVLEIRAAVGVQTPVEMARRGNRRLAALAADYSVDPAQLVIREDPPYTSIGLLRNGEFDPQIAVDDRNAARFGLSRQQLAERYLGQIRGRSSATAAPTAARTGSGARPWPCWPWGFTSSGCGVRSLSTGGSSAGSLIRRTVAFRGFTWAAINGSPPTSSAACSTPCAGSSMAPCCCWSVTSRSPCSWGSSRPPRPSPRP